jgi:hypothetical protein
MREGKRKRERYCSKEKREEGEGKE